MVILKTDNFGRDYVPDVIVATGLTNGMAECIVKLLNDDGGDYSEDVYSVEDDNYVIKNIEILP